MTKVKNITGSHYKAKKSKRCKLTIQQQKSVLKTKLNCLYELLISTNEMINYRGLDIYLSDNQNTVLQTHYKKENDEAINNFWTSLVGSSLQLLDANNANNTDDTDNNNDINWNDIPTVDEIFEVIVNNFCQIPKLEQSL